MAAPCLQAPHRQLDHRRRVRPVDVAGAVRGRYVFGDWERQWLRVVALAPGGQAGRGRREGHRDEGPGPVAIHDGPGKSLYYLALNSGDLRRIVYRP